MHAQLQPAAAGLAAQHLHDLFHQRVQVDRHPMGGAGACFQLGQIQQRIEQLVHGRHAVLEVCQQWRDGRVAIAQANCLHQHRHGVHRLAQIVAGRGEKKALVLQCRIDLALSLLQTVVGLPRAAVQHADDAGRQQHHQCADGGQHKLPLALTDLDVFEAVLVR
ncbi:hypothetical protein D3C72_1915350 [compost metagenome]